MSKVILNHALEIILKSYVYTGNSSILSNYKSQKILSHFPKNTVLKELNIIEQEYNRNAI